MDHVSGSWLGDAQRRLFVDDRGEPGAPALLYLHGGPGMGCYEFMAWQGELLSAQFRVVGLDQRGVLRSDPLAPNAMLTEDDLVADCELVRRALHIERWVVLGHSFGGRVALRYAVRHPDSVAAVMFENPGWDWREFERTRLPAAAEIFAEVGDIDTAAACRAMAAGALLEPWSSIELVGQLERYGRYYDLYGHQPEARRVLEHLGDANPYPQDWRERGARHGRALLEAPDVMDTMVPLLDSLTSPALLIKGQHDLVTGPTQVSGFRDRVTHGSVEVFSRSAHFVQLEEPDRYADLVNSFATAHW